MADGSSQVIHELRLASPVLEDFAYLAKRMRGDEIAQFLALSGQSSYDADVFARAVSRTPGSMWAYIDREGRPVLIGGFAPIRPGVYEGWHMASTEGWERYWRSFTKVSVRLMDGLLAQGAHRIQTCALESRTAAQHWYEKALGMTNEGLQAGYFADGQSGVMFARVKK